MVGDTGDGIGSPSIEKAEEETGKAQEALTEGTGEQDKVDGQTKALREMAEKLRSQAPHAVRLTPFGEKLVWKKDGKIVEDEGLSFIPCEREKALAVTLHDLMCTLYTAAQYINKQKRLIPITRDELIKPEKEGGCTRFGYKKGDLYKLEKLGLIKIGHTYLTEKGTGKKVGARVVIYPTSRGRGYIKKFIDEEFMSDAEDV